jgi:hypothetical protein
MLDNVYFPMCVMLTSERLILVYYLIQILVFRIGFIPRSRTLISYDVIITTASTLHVHPLAWGMGTLTPHAVLCTFVM